MKPYDERRGSLSSLPVFNSAEMKSNIPIRRTDPLEMFRDVSSIGDRVRFKYRIVARIDWIDIRVKTSSPTNGPSLFRRVGAYSLPIDAGAAGEASEFIVRFQDPESWQQICTKLLGAKIDPGCAIVEAVESAMDFELIGSGTLDQESLRYELCEVAAYLLALRTRIVKPENIRFYGGRGVKATAPLGFNHNVSKFLQEQLIAVGSHGSRLHARKHFFPDDQAQRIYFKSADKITDRRSGLILPKSEWRARDEVTLRGAELPFRSLGQAKEFKFTALACRWKYRMFRSDLSSMTNVDRAVLAAQLAVQPNIGVQRSRRACWATNRQTREFNRWFCADAVLNAATYEALRKLTRQMQGRHGI